MHHSNVVRFPVSRHVSPARFILRDHVPRFASASLGSRFPLACQAHKHRPPGNRSNLSNKEAREQLNHSNDPGLGSHLSLPGPCRACCGAFWRLLACDAWMSVLRWCILMRSQDQSFLPRVPDKQRDITKNDHYSLIITQN